MSKKNLRDKLQSIWEIFKTLSLQNISVGIKPISKMLQQRYLGKVSDEIKAVRSTEHFNGIRSYKELNMKKRPNNGD
jgi:hypothetical protein